MDQNPYRSPNSTSTTPDRPTTAGKVWVEVNANWVSRVRSPLFLLIAGLTGVSITFAPLGLVTLGSMTPWTTYHWLAAGTCFALIYFVPGWYMRLAGEVLKQLHSGDYIGDSFNGE